MFAIGAVVAVFGLGIVLLIATARYSVETARKGVEAVQAAALQGQTGDELVALGKRFGLNMIFVDGDERVQDSLEGLATHPKRSASEQASNTERSGALTMWGGFVFDRWFCDIELEHGKLKPDTQPKVYFLD